MPRNPFLDKVPVQEFPLVSYYLQDKLGTAGGGGTSDSASYADTASYALYAVSASQASTASYYRGSVISASYALDSTSASFADTASYVKDAISSSYALTASYAMNGGSGATFPYTGSALITGSLGITGSLSVSQSLDTSTRILYDVNGVGVVDWGNYILVDNSGINSLTWGERTLYDASERRSIEWTNRLLIDPSSVSSVDWERRTLKDSTGVTNLDWSTPGKISTPGVISASLGFTGSLFGTASWATNATTARTASFVNPLVQNVTITGSLIVSGSGGAGVFSKGGTVTDLLNGISTSGSYITWRAPFSCSVVALYGRRSGGTAPQINARRSGSAGYALHTGSNLTLTTADAWVQANSVTNVSYVAGDSLEIVVSGSGNSQVAVQVDYIKV